MIKRIKTLFTNTPLMWCLAIALLLVLYLTPTKMAVLGGALLYRVLKVAVMAMCVMMVVFMFRVMRTLTTSGEMNDDENNIMRAGLYLSASILVTGAFVLAI